MLIELCGRPGSGKTTLSGALADAVPVVLLRVDAIEAAMYAHDIAPEQAGYAAYTVMHALAGPHLARGQIVVADACSPVWQAREGWVQTARRFGAEHKVIELVCADDAEHRRRVETRVSDLDHFEVPTWDQVQAAEYQPRSDDRLVVDATRPLDEQVELVLQYLGLSPAQSPASPPRL